MVPTPKDARESTLIQLRLSDSVVDHVLRLRELHFLGGGPPHYTVPVIYGLPGGDHSITPRVLSLLRRQHMLSFDLMQVLVFGSQCYEAVMIEAGGLTLHEFREQLLEEFRSTHRDPWVLDWKPHLTIGHCRPGNAMRMFPSGPKCIPLAVPVLSVEVCYGEGSIDVLTPHGELSTCR